GQVRPVAVEVLDHVHGAVLELPAELGAHDVRLHRGVGRSGLAKQLEARPALLLAEIGLPSHAVDVEDHGLLLFRCDGEDPGAPAPRGRRLRLTSWRRWPSGSARSASRHSGTRGYGIGGRRMAAPSDTSRSRPASRSSTAKQTWPRPRTSCWPSGSSGTGLGAAPSRLNSSRCEPVGLTSIAALKLYSGTSP